MTLVLNVTSNPERVAVLKHLATLHGQQEAEKDYADARRYFDLQHFDMDEWITGEATQKTERTFGDITADDPIAARAIDRTAFTVAYRTTMQRLDRREA